MQAVALIVVARFVDVATFGELSVALAVMSFAFVAAAAGLPQFILRERALGHDQAVRAGLRANILTTVGAGLVLTVIAPFVVTDHVLLGMLGLVVAVGVDKNVDCQLSVPIADRQMATAVTSILGRALVFAVVFALVMVLTGGEGAVVAFVLGRLAAAALAVAHMALRPKADLGDATMTLRALAGEVWPIATSNLVSALRSLDSLIVFLVGGSAVAGLYGAASRPFAPASIVAGAAGAVLMPHSASVSWSELAPHIRRLRIIAVASTLALIPLAFLGPWVAVLVYGPRYEDAGVALGVFLLSTPAVISAAIVATLLQSRGFERFVVVNGLVFLPVFFLLVGAGTALFGATGAAAGFALGVWARNGGLSWGVRKLQLREESAE